MTDRAELLNRNPLVPFLEGRGFTLRGTGDKLTTNRCAGLEHKLAHQCVNVDAERGVWYCNDCEHGGSVIDFVMIADGVTLGEAMTRLGGESQPVESKRPPAPAALNGSGKPKMVKAYDYADEDGKLLFQVCRFDPKDFRQRAPDGKGAWIYKLEGIRRVLYNLPKVLAADLVFVCEGEKDADNLNGLGLVATTNAGGAKKWDKSFTAALRGKDIVLLPDNDKAGGEHRDELRAALGPVVKSIRIVEMPDGCKDVTDFLETFPEKRDGVSALMELAEKVEVLHRGESVPVQTMAELEDEYRAHVKRAATHQLSLGAWLPSLAWCVRPLVPGELFTVLAGTGCGKTMFLQNLALNTSMATLLFESELPGTLTFERFAAMATKRTGGNIQSLYQTNGTAAWRETGKLDHVSCCHLSNLTPERIARIIDLTELKTCVRPVLVLVDYIQLIRGAGDSRYERTSLVAEQLKTVAKATGTIIVTASQIARSATRDGKEAREVTLTDGKDSGSIENSSGLVIGGWRDGEDSNRLWLRILKNTKGVSGKTIACRISESLLINEEAPEPEP